VQKLVVTPSFTAQVDKYRGLFALMVLFGHAMDVSHADTDGTDYFLNVVRPGRTFFGFVWVVAFVVMSGFCIQLSIRNARVFSVGRYSVQRVSRIYPLLIACVLLTAAFEWIMAGSSFRPAVWRDGINSTCFWNNLAGLGGFTCQFGSIAPAYTLSYELLYYVLWGATLFVVGSRIGLALALNFAVTVLAIFVPAMWQGYLSPFWVAVFKPFILMIYLPWLIGAATATYMERLVQIGAVRFASRYAWVYLLFLTMFSFADFKMPAWDVTVQSVAFYALLSVGVAMLIVNAYARREEIGAYGGRRLLGELSYPVYLAHGPVIIFVGYLLARQGMASPGLLHFTVLVTCAIFVSCVFVVAVERPVMRMRRKFAAWAPVKVPAPRQEEIAPASGEPIPAIEAVESRVPA
jgi:peptidoglycan/LPS O-acetylase OafA/YrhL